MGFHLLWHTVELAMSTRLFFIIVEIIVSIPDHCLPFYFVAYWLSGHLYGPSNGSLE